MAITYFGNVIRLNVSGESESNVSSMSWSISLDNVFVLCKFSNEYVHSSWVVEGGKKRGENKMKKRKKNTALFTLYVFIIMMIVWHSFISFLFGLYFIFIFFLKGGSLYLLGWFPCRKLIKERERERKKEREREREREIWENVRGGNGIYSNK